MIEKYIIIEMKFITLMYIYETLQNGVHIIL